MNSKITEVIKGITEEILVLMKTEKGNWTKPWVGVHSISNKTHEYQGFNCLILALARHKNGWQRQVWGTYKQWKDAECQVDKDQQGTTILRPQIIKGKDLGYFQYEPIFRYFQNQLNICMLKNQLDIQKNYIHLIFLVKYVV